MSPNEARIRRLVTEGAFTTVFQPIFSLSTGALTSVEALTRVRLGAISSPAWWLAEARAVGLGVTLEREILERALTAAVPLPEGVTLSVNLSPTALADPAVLSVLRTRPVEALIVELTEQPAMWIHPRLLRNRVDLGEVGVRLAVGNVAAKRASMARLLALRPDQIKTELWLTAEIDTDPARRILARKLLRVAHHQDAEVVAEGIETSAQLAAWRELGADAVQGFLLAVPAPLEDAVRTTSIPLRS